MTAADLTAGDWFLLAQHELFLFAAVFFLIGAIDEVAIDALYVVLRLKRGPHGSFEIEPPHGRRHLAGSVAVFIPAWHEARVIGPTLGHALAVWPHRRVRFYIGCYRNDPETLLAAMAAATGDARVRLVVHDRDGPTSKADCLNRLYRALAEDERRAGAKARMVVLQDAEDMVDASALELMDAMIDNADFVQLPVLALPQRASRWIAGHYTDEFAEVHGKTMVVRDALGAAIPGAGVGCAVERATLAGLAARGGGEPFSTGSLTEDYELGLEVAAMGGRTRFVRARDESGSLIATRAFFPARLDEAVRQKTRWVHGIALQSWDRLGWRGGVLDLWMQMRDRRGPFAALLLATGYALLLLFAAQFVLATLGLIPELALSPLLEALLFANLAALALRMVVRMAFTAREYGWREGLIAVPRILVSNVIAIMAGRRALVAYVRTLKGQPLRWDKTEHRDHPVFVADGGLPA